MRAPVAVALLALATAVVGGGGGVAAAMPCAAADVAVAVVVDFGDGAGAAAVCVPASDRENGALVLGRRAERLGTPAPRFHPANGLLCAIDGVPAEGCGDTLESGRMAYWSYWLGTDAGWEYASIGPAGHRVRGDVTEGWRFQPDGAANPSDPAPGTSARPDVCAPPAPPPSTEPVTAPTVAASTTTTTEAPASGAADTATTATSRVDASTTSTRRSRSAAPAPVTANEPANSGDGGGVPVGLVAGIALIGAFGAAAFVVTRRRDVPR